LKSIVNRTLLSLIILFFVSGASGQTGNNSPYSRYGIGDLYTNNGILNMAIGGTSLGFRSSFFVNPQNPASYTAFDSLSFRFEGSFYSRLSSWKTLNLSQKSSYGSLGNLLFGFPVNKWLKTSFGLLPFSNIGYSIRDDQQLPGIGHTRFEYIGKGGLNQVYIGAGIEPVKNFSAGVNASYLFGTIDKSRATTFPDSAHMMFTHTGTITKVGHLYYSFGAQYHITQANHLFYTIGLTYSPKQTISTTYENVTYSYLHDYTQDYDYNMDTLAYSTGVKSSLVLPQNFGAGIMIGKTDKWMGGFDVQFQDWKTFRFNGKGDSLGNGFRISAGGQYTPDMYSVGKFWKRVTYRAGLRFNQSYLDLRNTPIKEFGLSFGAGIPTRRTQRDFRSSVNVAMEIGSRGTTTQGLLKENFFRFSLGLSLFDRWFIQRKYE
jgi:hypothetical protein